MHRRSFVIQYFPVRRESDCGRSRGTDRRLVRESSVGRVSPQSLTTSATGVLGTTVIAIALLATTCLQSVAADLERRLRRPVALVLSGNSQWLYTANRDSGSISVVDTSTRSVEAEIDIGGRLSDLAALDDRHLLALDEKNHQLVLLTGGDVRWRVAARLEIAQYPVRLQVDRTASRCFISSLWSRAVTLVDLSEVHQEPEPRLRVLKKLWLSFEPREMCLAMDGKRLIVAGSFNDTLAVVDTDGLELVAAKKILGHNIRGLRVSGDGKRLLVTQQELNSLARSTRDDVHWGNMLSNLLVSLSVDDVCDAQADILEQRVVHYLGEPGTAAGDPGPISVGPNDKLAIVLSGVNEVALGRNNDVYDFRRVAVGRRPSAVVSTPSAVFVADMFSDSVSIVDVAAARLMDRVSLGPQPELSPSQLGEMLFFDSRLSHDGWMSCHSCHTDGHSSGQLNDNLSDGSFGAPKRVLSLLGVGQTGPWAWNGKVKTLEEQVSSSIQNTMQGEEPTKKQVAALVAYLKTLPAAPTLPDVAEGKNSDEICRGRELFRSLDCQRCHAPPTYTTAQAYDVGLTDSVGNERFNPPSLRGVQRRQAFFHDAREKSLADVFLNHKHQLNRDLSTSELDSLLRFLESI